MDFKGRTHFVHRQSLASFDLCHAFVDVSGGGFIELTHETQ
jgi:hypothetical protein